MNGLEDIVVELGCSTLARMLALSRTWAPPGQTPESHCSKERTSFLPRAAATLSSCFTVGECRGSSSRCAAAHDVLSARAISESGLPLRACLTNNAAWQEGAGETQTPPWSEDSGISSPSSMRASSVKVNTSVALNNASASVSPSVIASGRSGKVTVKPPSGCGSRMA